MNDLINPLLLSIVSFVNGVTSKISELNYMENTRELVPNTSYTHTTDKIQKHIC